MSRVKGSRLTDQQKLRIGERMRKRNEDPSYWQKQVLYYIRNNSGYKTTEVQSALDEKISKPKFYVVLNELKKRNLVLEYSDAANRKIMRLKVADYVISAIDMPRKLDDLQKSFAAVIKKIPDGKSRKPDSENKEGRLGPLLPIIQLYDQLARLHNLHCTLDWPFRIQDKEIRRDLYVSTFDTLGQIQNNLANAAAKAGKTDFQYALEDIMTQEHGYNDLASPAVLERRVKNLSRYGLEKEARALAIQILGYAEGFYHLIGAFEALKLSRGFDTSEDYKFDIQRDYESLVQIDPHFFVVKMESRVENESREAKEASEFYLSEDSINIDPWR